jgi:hypothetical protein
MTTQQNILLQAISTKMYQAGCVFAGLGVITRIIGLEGGGVELLGLLALGWEEEPGLA